MATATDNEKSIHALVRQNIMRDVSEKAIRLGQEVIIASFEKAGIEIVSIEELNEMKAKKAEALKPAEPKKETPPAPEPSIYEDKDVDELREEAEKRELKFHPSTGKVKLIALLEKDDLTNKTTDSTPKEDDDEKTDKAF